ncbi:unnamed protein product, partial [Polarella glacialis]
LEAARGKPRGVSGRVLALAAAASIAHIATSSWSPFSFVRTAEWTDRTELRGDDTLPLITDVGMDAGLARNGFGINVTGVSGTGSFIADFGELDFPVFGRLRARAGLRYSPLFPRGALELGFRKEMHADSEGYELFMGVQTVGDDRRLDVVTEVGAIKLFRGARAFYRFLWGAGTSFEGEGPSWHEMGSSLGVTQTEMPPGGRGKLTIGWRTGLWDRGLEGGAVAPTAAGRRKAQQKGLRRNLLDSTPFASYGLELPGLAPRRGEKGAHFGEEPRGRRGPFSARSWRAQRAARDSAGGRAVLTAVLEQPLGVTAGLRLMQEGPETMSIAELHRSRLLAVVDVILFFTTAVIATRYWLETHSRIGALQRRFVNVDSLVVRRLFLQLLSLANVLRAFGLVLDAEF